MEIGIVDLVLLLSTWSVVAYITSTRYKISELEAKFHLITKEWKSIQTENEQLFNEFGIAAQEKDKMIKEFGLVLERLVHINSDIRKLKETLPNPPASNE